MLHPRDVFLAFALQTRSAQRALSGEEKDYGFDWEYLFKAANVEQTAKSNRREARAKVKRKVDNFKQQNIIGNPISDKKGVMIEPKIKKT